MIFAQTRSAFVARENRCTLFRVVRWRLPRVHLAFISRAPHRHRSGSAATCDHSAHIQPRRNKMRDIAFKP
jgi:hypothetical protein